MDQYMQDIPLNLAVSAFNGTSFSPEKRGESYRNDYAKTLSGDYETLRQHAEKGGTVAMLEEEFARYRDGYGKRYRAWLASHGRCISSMITGPSNFPTRMAEKRSNVEHKRMGECIAFRESALKAAIRNLRPDLRPIMAGDDNAVTRLQAEIDKAEAMQARMKAINAAHKKFQKDPAILDVLDLSDDDRRIIRNYKPAYSWEPHPFAPYELSNLSANIRRMKERFTQISTAKATPATEMQGDGVRIEDCPADNRIRLFFEGKPEAEIRDKLKRGGFRWAPSIGAWQAYRNHNAMNLAKSFAEAVAV